MLRTFPKALCCWRNRMNSKPTKPLIMGAPTTQVHKTSALRATEATMKLCNVPKFLRAPSFYGCFRCVFKHPRNMARNVYEMVTRGDGDVQEKRFL